MVFKPYPLMGGWIAQIKVKDYLISVRYGGHGLLTDSGHPYEVWYPTQSEPDGYQTADDIWNYIKNISEENKN